jgi:serine phosphatase RsbU (regulator of sigma subunit)
MHSWPLPRTTVVLPRWSEYRRLAIWAVPIAAVPMADTYVPPNVHLAHLLVIPLALATAFTDTRRTAVTAVLAVAALLTAAFERDALTTENVLVQVLSLVLFSLVLLLLSRRREQNQRRLARARRVSEATQAVLLRPLPQCAGPVSVASAYVSADTEARIGGDLYALVRTPGTTRLIIGDARGKGLGAIGDVQPVLGAFRFAAHQHTTLSELAAALERSVRRDLAEGPLADTEEWSGEHFVTAAVLEIPDDEPCARLVSFGHTPPLLLRDGTVVPVKVDDPAPPLGLGGLAHTAHAPKTFHFAPGDRLLLYTDGVTEARDAHGAFYPLAERTATLAGHRPDALVEAICQDVHAYTDGRLADDMAMIALEREGVGIRPPSAAR